MCDIIWCKKCETVNYLDPFNFWNWEGKINCAGCNTNYYIHMIQGHMYKGPEEKPAGKPDISPLLADKPLQGYQRFLPGVEGKTRPYRCLPREIYLGKADIRKFSIRNRPLRAWPNQPPTKKIAGSRGYAWDIKLELQFLQAGAQGLQFPAGGHHRLVQEDPLAALLVRAGEPRHRQVLRL